MSEASSQSSLNMSNPNLFGMARASVDSASFAAGMRYLAGSCSVIATRSGALRAGLTATAVCSVSADPARLLICVNKSVYAHDVIHEAGLLSVNVLSEQQEETARRFAGMVMEARGEDRFVAPDWEDGKLAIPRLKDALVSFGCRVVDAIPGGKSHTVFICDVIEVRCTQEAQGPLMYFNRNFSKLKM
ncbi:flavin reductase family protein [Paraburkholderia franconis]|nr:flavin reductase family protein [Paraburkholderia franconis]